MPITVFTDNTMERLAGSLGEKIRAELPAKGVFYHPQVIVPNRGIARFLTLQFTEKNQIVMGMEFPFLMTCLLRNVGQIAGDVQEQGEEAHELSCWDAMINTESLALRICSLLPDLMDSPEFAVLKRYVGTGRSALRRWQLAEKAALLFDRYILHRPDWILQWEAADQPLAELNGSENHTEKWQRSLWRAVRKDWPAGAGDRAVHFGHIYQKIRNGALPSGTDDVIRLFGFSTFPAPVLDCLEKLDIPVEIYSLSPCCEYWGDAKNRKQELRELVDLWEKVRLHGVSAEQEERFFRSQEELFFQNNPLLGSFAAQGRKFFVRSLEWENRPTFSSPAEPVTLLEKIRYALQYNHRVPETEPEYAGPPDTSVQIHSCCSEFREVECLHDYLLNCFADDPSLTFNDIIIMSPTPERYAPFLEAVFHNPANQGHMLQVSCSEQASADCISALQGFLKLLHCGEEHFEASLVMDILSIPGIPAHFGIPEEELNFLRQSVADAGICWGWDAEEHAAHGGNAFAETSWRRGLDRLLLGYAVAGSVPFDAPDGIVHSVNNFSERGELLGKFCRFAEELRATVLKVRSMALEPVPINVWCDFLLERAGTFWGSESGLCAFLRSQLANLRRNAENAQGGKMLFETDTMLAILQKISDAIPGSSRDFLRGKITFCGLRPMRSIPGKIVCLLGMNHDTFPQRSSSLSFDLMNSFPRTDDPSQSDDERQLFIEILLSARNALYISYCGRGIRDNKKYPASCCVEELRNYMREAFGSKSWYDAEEPIRAFDPSLFEDGNPVQSHSEVLCRCAGRLLASEGSSSAGGAPFFHLTEIPGEIPEDLYRVTLTDLQRFFRNPAAAFMRKRLDAVPFEDAEVLLPEAEPLFLQAVPFEDQQYTFARMLETPEEEHPQLRRELLNRMQSDGKLPFFRKLDEAWPQWDEAGKLCDNIRRFMGGEVREIKSRTVEIGRFKLVLPAQTLYNDALVSPLFFTLEGTACQYVLAHVAANLSGEAESLIVSASRCFRLEPLGEESAAEKMKQILSLYEEGMRSPLHFFPKTAFAVFRAEENEERACMEAWKKEKDKFEKYYGPILPNSGLLSEYAERFYLDFKEV